MHPAAPPLYASSMQASLATGSVLALFCLAQPALTQDQGKPIIEITEVSVKKKPKTKDVSFFGNEGVEIKAVVLVPGQAIIAMDKPGTVCASFQDDQGTDLKAGMKTGFFHWASLSMGFGNKKREDAVTIAIKTTKLPSAKAGRATLNGTLTLVTAAGTDVAEAKVALAKGTAFEVGGYKLNIGRVKKSNFGNAKLAVTIESSQNLDGIKKVEFLDDGKPIKADSQGSGRMGFGDQVTYSKSYGLSKELASVTVKITYYKGQKKVAIPLKLDLGLGF